jgi:hypothetical protein
MGFNTQHQRLSGTTPYNEEIMFKYPLRHYLFASVLLGTGTPALATPSSTEVFNRYIEAANAGDMGTIATLIAPDVERSDFVGCRAEMDNPSCLLHYIKTTVVDPKTNIRVTNIEVAGDVVTATLELRGGLTERAGVERAVGKDVVRITDGRIKAFHFIPDFTDESTAVFFGSLGIGPRAAAPASKP